MEFLGKFQMFRQKSQTKYHFVSLKFLEDLCLGKIGQNHGFGMLKFTLEVSTNFHLLMKNKG